MVQNYSNLCVSNPTFLSNNNSLQSRINKNHKRLDYIEEFSFEVSLWGPFLG